MKRILIVTLLYFILSFNITSQTSRPYDAYQIEENTYITNPVLTDNGLYFSDNYYSTIYHYNGGNISIILQSPGCGRYIQVSSDKTKLGFKIITENGIQSPAIYDILAGKVIELEEGSEQCGQVFFNNKGDIYYTVGNTAYIISGNNKRSFNLGQVCNYISYSDFLNTIVYTDFSGRLFAYDISDMKNREITNSLTGTLYPIFSPDGKKLTVNASGGGIYLYDFIKSTLIFVDNGGGVKWTGNNSFVYNRNSTDQNGIGRADIIEYNNGVLTNHTMSENISELQPCPAGTSSVIYNTYDDRSVYSMNLKTGEKNLLFRHNNPLPVKFYEIKTNKSDITVPGVVPYIHQVYDTPTWHEGWGSCAPTTSTMSYAYYNQLPPWPVEVDHGYSWDPHINNYGSYVADRYRFNEYYYQETADAYGTTAYGGYGFMWTGSYSPNLRMKSYHEQHYQTSNQLWLGDCTYANTVNEIDLGYVHPICSYITSSGHLKLTKGYVQGYQTLIFNDPYGNKNNPGYPNYSGAGAKYDWPGANNGYQNLDATGTHGVVAWTVRARYSEITYNDTIIDNNYYGHGFYVNNTQDGSHQRYFRDFNAGYNGHTWFTMTDALIPDICWVTWTPNLHQSGYYEVFAYIPSEGASTTEAPYRIYHDNGVSTTVVNQSSYSDQWASLGIYHFSQGLGGHVYLGDSTNIDGDMIAYDAMWWSFRPSAASGFTTASNDVCQGETVNFNNTSSNSNSYTWQFQGGTPTVSTEINPSVMFNNPGVYTVTLVSSNQYSSDTSATTIHVNSLPFADFNAVSTLLYLPNANATFTNNSLNSNQYFWDFGDGTNSTDVSPPHQYSNTGTYTVMLVASNTDCPSDTLYKFDYITVDDPSSVIANENSEIIYHHDGKIFYELNESNINAEIISTDGKIIFKTVLSGSKGSLNTNLLSKGIYICNMPNKSNGIKKFKFCVY